MPCPLARGLEEFRLDVQLGAGGFGIPTGRHDELLDKVVAVKEYLPRDFATRTAGSTVAPISDADARDYQWGLTRFLDEARTLARFDHPHLNKVRRFFEANGTAYMVLEYIHGETLAARLSPRAALIGSGIAAPAGGSVIGPGGHPRGGGTCTGTSSRGI